MDEKPEIPEPVPQVPRGALWRALAIPPVVTFFGNMLIGLGGRDYSDLTITLLPLVVCSVILIYAVFFNLAVGQRYRGTSLVFLRLSYLFGQIIVCLALWIGSCALFLYF